jgi:hypothetical protein
MQPGLRHRMTTPRDIPLTPRESSEDSSHDRAAILTMDDADEHDQLLPSDHEAENLLSDPIQYGTVWMILTWTGDIPVPVAFSF